MSDSSYTNAAPNKRLQRTRRRVTFIRSCVGEPLKRNVMWLLMCARTLFLLAVLGLSPIVAAAQESSTSEEQIPTIRFCDLISDPSRYDKNLVRTPAIYVAFYHGTFLYDPSCRSNDANVNAEFESSSPFKTS